MERDLGSIEERVAAGEEAALQGWLASHVWSLGRSVDGEELVEQVTGAPLAAAPFLAYLGRKVQALLGGG